MAFFPLKFLAVLDLVDTFGFLVFERIKRLAFPLKSEAELLGLASSVMPD